MGYFDSMALKNTTEALKQGANSPNLRLAMIESFMCLILVIFLVLSILGLYRRRSANSFVRLAVWAAYASSYGALFYTLGLMNSAPFRNDLFAIWAILVLYVLDSTDSLAAYGLHDTANAWRCLWDIFIAVIYVGMVVIKHTVESGLRIPIWMLYAACLARPGFKFAALKLAGKSAWLMHCTKVVADFMSVEHKMPALPEDVPSDSLRGYYYVVTGEGESKVEVYDPYDKCLLFINDEEVVTVDRVWRCDGKLLSTEGGDPDGRLKDTCLSFALFKLIRRRYAGYQLEEAEEEKTWSFVRDRLLSRADLTKAFRVVEVELAFLFDFFYTKYAAMMDGGFPSWKFCTEVIALVHAIWIAIHLKNDHFKNSEVNRMIGHGINIDVLITRIVLIGWVLVQLLQFYALWSSYWVKIWLLCKYIRFPKWHDHWPIFQKFIQFLCHLSYIKPWANKIGQNNFLSVPCGWWWDLKRSVQLPESNRYIKLPDEVKTKVLSTLKAHKGRTKPILTNGISALEKNNLKHLDVEYRFETNTHRIVVWHIATSLCEILSPINRHGKPVDDDPISVATVLSNYLGYLVAFAPDLLPGNGYSTTLVYESVVSDIIELKRSGKWEILWQKRDNLEEAVSCAKQMTKDLYLVRKGIDLGLYLITEVGDVERWKVLDEFWAEMMLFVAPSDNLTAHAERLAGGGEFVTHLWALLMHAGILESSQFKCPTNH